MAATQTTFEHTPLLIRQPPQTGGHEEIFLLYTSAPWEIPSIFWKKLPAYYVIIILSSSYFYKGEHDVTMNSITSLNICTLQKYLFIEPIKTHKLSWLCLWLCVCVFCNSKSTESLEVIYLCPKTLLTENWEILALESPHFLKNFCSFKHWSVNIK